MATNDGRDNGAPANEKAREVTSGTSMDRGPQLSRGMPDHWDAAGDILLFFFGFITLPVVDLVALFVLAVLGVPRAIVETVSLAIYAAGLAFLFKFFPKPAAIGALLGVVIPLIAFGACLAGV